MRKSKTVMFLCGYQSPYGGNFVPSLMALEDTLKAHGLSTVYVFLEEAKQRHWYAYLEQKGKCVETFSRGKNHFQMINNIQKLIIKHEVSILHTHFISPLIAALISYRNAKINVVMHIHCDFSAEIKGLPLKIREFCSYRLFSGKLHFLSVSEKYLKWNPNKIDWVPNALATNRIPYEKKGAEFVRRNSGVHPNEILLEVFAWSPYVKGLDIVVNAVKQLKEEGVAVKLGIICGRQMIPAKMRNWVKENTLCTGTEDYLLFWEPIEDVFSYHEAADIIVSSSRSDGFSYAVLEMLSLGKRCVISDIPGLSWAKDYRQTVYFASEDIGACAEGIKKALNLPQNDLKMRDEVLENHHIEKWIEKIIEVYKIEDYKN